MHMNEPVSKPSAVEEILRSWNSGGLRAIFVSGATGQLQRAVQEHRPDILVVQGMRHDAAELEALERLTAEQPRLAVVLLSSDQTPEYLRHAMRAGVREVLPLAIARDALVEVLERLRQRLGAAAARSKGRIVSFVGCKGGSGATFLAANLAYLLAENPDKRVALIDLNCQLGDAALYVTHRNPGCTLADVALHIERLDGELLATSMTQVAPNFHLLPAPDSPEQALHVRPEHVSQLLTVAVAHYDFVVIDAGRSLDGASVRALDQSEMIFAVLQPSLPFLRDAKRLLSALASLGYGKDKVQLIVNRFDAKSPISMEDVVQTLRCGAVRTIPNSFHAVAASVNQGEPICRLSPRDAVARALRELAALFLPQAKAQAGWLRGMLART